MEKENVFENLQIDFELLSKPFVVLPDGTHETLGAFERMLYSYLKAKYEFCSNNCKSYYENQESIWSCFPFVSLKTIQRAIKTLECCGLLEVTRKTGVDGKSNKYKVNRAIMAEGVVEKNCKMFRHETSFPKKTQTVLSVDNTPVQGYKFYVQYWFAPFFECVKFGITNNAEERRKQQQRSSMFSHVILKEWDIPSVSFGQNLEKEIKRKFDHSGCMKVWAPDGYTETVSKDDKESLIAFINDIINKNL